jgi:tetratricopeptide (TPR) repeat protein
MAAHRYQPPAETGIHGCTRRGWRATAVLAVFVSTAWALPLLAQGDPAADLWRRAQGETQADSAAVLMRRLIEAYPRHELARAAGLALADYYFARGDYPLSRVFYHRAAEGKDGSAGARLGEARSYYALGDYPTARSVVRPLLRSEDPALRWSASFLTGLSWQAEKQFEEADAVYRRLLEESPGPAQPAALLAAARVAIELEDGVRAEDLLLRLRSQYPDSPEAVESRRMEPRRHTAEDAGS